MKKIIAIIISAGLLIVTGCSKLELEEELFSSYAASNFYQDPSQLVTQAWGIYSISSYGFGYQLYQITEKQSKYFARKTNRAGFAYYNVLPTDAAINTMWQKFYTCINRANVQIKYAPGVNTSQTVIDNYIADARFMRAWSYFCLVRLFGEIPVYTEPTESVTEDVIHKSPTSVEDIYMNVIIPDLEFAVANLPAETWPLSPSTRPGRALQPAARSLLAEVYLSMAGRPLNKGSEYFQKSYDASKALIDAVDAGTYDLALQSDWASVFSVDNEENSEIVFSLKTTREGLSSGSRTPNEANPRFSHGVFTSINGTGSKYWWAYDTTYIQLFETTDMRYTDGFIWSYTDSKNRFIEFDKDSRWPPASIANYNTRNGICQIKYQDPHSVTNVDQAKDHILIRYVEAYLMAAEAACELGQFSDALTYINAVRSRVNATPFTSTDQAVLRQQIRDERFRELIGEFNSIYDIRRWGVAEEHFTESPIYRFGAVSIPWDDKFYEWPLPEKEVTLNPNLSPNW